MAKIGVPQFKDVINENTIEFLKRNINSICINFNKFAAKPSIENRESNLFEEYATQYKMDFSTLLQMRLAAQEIVDKCNWATMILSTRAIKDHIFPENEDGSIPEESQFNLD